ncbi:ankyrin repeat-containing domain protein [Tribonema minus]|uniref:Ankyrin repeat-containing domain protein n=1 Tax=Tribonema minus TaxID=303371 RepID=A0A835Z9H8_9STRA|nr:ankyrin repeat-containing domain protein [Tribonema minus]
MPQRPEGERIFSAVRAGRINAVERWINDGGDVNGTDENGWSPLHICCEAGNYELAELLLENSAQVVELLLDSGATCDVRGAFARTPLHCAAFNGAVQTVRMLLDDGADPLARDAAGRCPADTVEDALILDAQREEILALLRDAAARPRHHIGSTQQHEPQRQGTPQQKPLLYFQHQQHQQQQCSATPWSKPQAAVPPLGAAAPSIIPLSPHRIDVRAGDGSSSSGGGSSAPRFELSSSGSGGGGSAPAALEGGWNGYRVSGGGSASGGGGGGARVPPQSDAASPQRQQQLHAGARHQLCRGCSTPIASASYKFCPECGCQQRATSPPPQQQQQRSVIAPRR